MGTIRHAQDRTELNDLSEQQPEIRQRLQKKWDAWAERVHVLTPQEFAAARKAAATHRN